jgi:RNA polymerase sigma-70 factor, ECF subfamily
MDSLATFESHRAALLALAYRMLGDLARAEDIVQDAWVRWQRLKTPPDSPRALLVKMVTRQCLNELDSARARREESRSDRLPEPVQPQLLGFDPLERADQLSMAVLVTLQRLTPSERAVFLLHEVLDFDHAEIAKLLQKTAEGCRQLLKRAKDNVAEAKRSFAASREEHLRLQRAFIEAGRSGDLKELTALLADDVVLIADGGPDGVTVGQVRNVAKPVRGAKKVAAIIASFNRRGPAALVRREWDLNGQPAIVAFLHGRPVFAVLLTVAQGRVQNIFIHADPKRLSHLGVLH